MAQAAKLNPLTLSSGQLRTLIYLDRLEQGTFCYQDIKLAIKRAGYVQGTNMCKVGNFIARGLLTKIDEDTYEIHEEGYRVLTDFQKMFEDPEYTSRYSKTRKVPNVR